MTIKLNVAHKVNGDVIVIEDTPAQIKFFEANGYIVVGFHISEEV